MFCACIFDTIDANSPHHIEHLIAPQHAWVVPHFLEIWKVIEMLFLIIETQVEGNQIACTIEGIIVFIVSSFWQRYRCIAFRVVSCQVVGVQPHFHEQEAHQVSLKCF